MRLQWIKTIAGWMWKAISYKSRIEKKMDLLLTETQENTKGLLRLRYLYFVEHRPTEVSVICAIYDEYKKRGGNSEIDAIHAEWKKDVAKGIYKRKRK